MSFGSVDPQKQNSGLVAASEARICGGKKNIKVVHSSTAARAGSSVDDFIVWDYLVGGFNPSEKYS